MIQVNELRKGNLLMYGSRMAVVSAIFKSHFKCESLEQICFGNSLQSNFQPIPLTPEILEKCGFDWSIYHQAFRQHKDTVEFYYLNECYPSGFQFSTFKKQQLIGNPINHLHQLQNLYFALTGEELTFKP